jgi:hypothetical protein
MPETAMGGNSSGSGKKEGAPDLTSPAVAAHLQAILDSPAFRSSHRSCQFLRYVVELSLSGHPDLLRERMIGEHVFGRPADYDTGQDSIVRVKANEVRRRLAQYYDLHPDAPIRIELPAGSYTAQFHASRRTLAQTAARRWRVPRIWIAAALVVAVAAASLAFWGIRRHSAFRTFWAPFIDSQRDLMLCVPAQIISETGQSVGIRDARSLALLYAFASAPGRAPRIRAGDEATFNELRAGPGILIGSFTNPWKNDLLRDARFVLEPENANYGIRDRSNGSFLCQNWNGDCAVVTRFAHSQTGHPLLIAEVLDPHGSFEPIEFLTLPDLLEAALAEAPPGWRDGNLQIVVRTGSMKDHAGPPKVLATHVW